MPKESATGPAAYLELAERGGFPTPAAAASAVVRESWLETYLEHIAMRDAPMVAGVRNPDAIRRLIEVIALHSGGQPPMTRFAEDIGVDRRTAERYITALRNLRLLCTLPAWRSNRLKRVTSIPKIGLIDPALIFGALRTDSAGALHDGNLVGRIVGIEVKATTSPTVKHAKSLLWLAEQLGEKFVGGAVLHTGSAKGELAEGIWALPIAQIWAG